MRQTHTALACVKTIKIKHVCVFENASILLTLSTRKWSMMSTHDLLLEAVRPFPATSGVSFPPWLGSCVLNRTFLTSGDPCSNGLDIFSTPRGLLLGLCSSSPLSSRRFRPHERSYGLSSSTSCMHICVNMAHCLCFLVPSAVSHELITSTVSVPIDNEHCLSAYW